MCKVEAITVITNQVIAPMSVNTLTIFLSCLKVWTELFQPKVQLIHHLTTFGCQEICVRVDGGRKWQGSDSLNGTLLVAGVSVMRTGSTSKFLLVIRGNPWKQDCSKSVMSYATPDRYLPPHSLHPSGNGNQDADRCLKVRYNEVCVLGT